LDTKSVKPLSHPIENENVFRDDKLKKSVSQEEALKNAPDRTTEHFKVPKVISQKDR
jgi:aspartyl-tRNA(Asn)/glutamyl-tRNA(Gln) amidotransferase subunit C